MSWKKLAFRRIGFRSNGRRRILWQTVVLLMVAGTWGFAQEVSLPRRPDRGSRPSPIVPTKPFHILGNIYYVGQTDNSRPGADDAAYLITTPEGHILLNTALEQDFKQIPPNIQKMGFRLEDIKFLIHSHSHADHVGGDALLKKAVPGVKIFAMKGDAEVMANGGKTDFDPHRRNPGFPPVQADRILKDGDTVQLGGTKMVAHLTAGHTEGCTTWSMVVEDGGQKYETVFLCSGGYHPGVKLVNDLYPNMVADFLRAFRVMKSLKVDVYLSAHGADTKLVEKAIRLEKGASRNPFIDPAGYKAVVDEMEKEFLAEMKKQGVARPAGL